MHINPRPGLRGSVERIINFSGSSAESSRLILLTYYQCKKIHMKIHSSHSSNEISNEKINHPYS